MSCEDPRQNPIRRCVIEALNWNTNSYFETCPVCGEPTSLICVDDPTPTWSESKQLEAELVAERNEAQRKEGRGFVIKAKTPSAEQARHTSAAVASLHYDLDQWLTLDPATLDPAAERGIKAPPPTTAEVALARRTRAATAALRHDLDQWLTIDPAVELGT